MEVRSAASRSSLRRLLGVNTVLCVVDEGYDPDEGKESKPHRIGISAEPGVRVYGLGGACPTRTTGAHKNAATEGTSGNGKDNTPTASQHARSRLSVRGLWIAGERILVSHDYVDFQAAKRATIHGRLGVVVIEADVCEPRL